MTADQLAAVAGIATAVAALLGFGAIVWEVRLDHRRRRSQATIEMLAATRDRRASLRALVLDTGKSPFELMEDLETRRALNQWLSDFEFLALGVNMGVFDEETLDRMSGGGILAAWEYTSEWIYERRSERSSLLYVEFEELVSSIVRRRTKLGKPTSAVSFYDAKESPG